MSRSIAPVLAALLSACDGEFVPFGQAPGSSGGGGPGSSAWELTRFTCDATQRPDEVPLRRLSRQQYVNTVRAVVSASGLAVADAEAALGAVAGPLAAFPEDRRVGVPGETHGGFTQLDQAIQQGHIDASYQVAVELGRELTSTTSRRRALLGACGTDTSTTNDAQCLRDFVGRFGALAHRRPLDAADVDFYVQAAGSSPVAPEAVADVVALLLTAPRFLYHVEEGTPGALSPLDGYALASRLSFHFWQSMPDQALLDAAAAGALETEAGFAAQARRLLADPRTEAALDDFFGHWFRLDELPPLNTRIGTPVFDAFAGADVPSPTLHEEMKAEVLEAARFTARAGGTVTELLVSRQFFARSPALARLYGQEPWDGRSTPPLFAQPQRAGLLTRAAFLASGSANTRPVMKGFRVRNALLCQSIPPPPANAMAATIELGPDLTTRETVAAITEVPGCSGCHTTILNPLGYATEDFDALGRHRTVQQLYDATGRPTVARPVDTRAIPHVSGVTQPVEGIADVTRLLAEGGEFQTCFARQYFRFTFQRMEDERRDGCLLRALQDAAVDGRPLSEVLLATALSAEFRRKDFR